MLWKPQEPIYPKLIKTTIEGLSIEETKEMRKKGLAAPALTKLGNFLSFNYQSYSIIVIITIINNFLGINARNSNVLLYICVL